MDGMWHSDCICQVVCSPEGAAQDFDIDLFHGLDEESRLLHCIFLGNAPCLWLLRLHIKHKLQLQHRVSDYQTESVAVKYSWKEFWAGSKCGDLDLLPATANVMSSLVHVGKLSPGIRDLGHVCCLPACALACALVPACPLVSERVGATVLAFNWMFM